MDICINSNPFSFPIVSQYLFNIIQYRLILLFMCLFYFIFIFIVLFLILTQKMYVSIKI